MTGGSKVTRSAGRKDPRRDPSLDDVRDKAERMSRARRSRDTFWRSLLHVGVLGWVFILPALAGGVLGRFLARRLGMPWIALAGLLLGLFAGGLAVFLSVKRTLIEEEDDMENRKGGKGAQ